MSKQRTTDREPKLTTHITKGSRTEGNIKTSDNVRIDGEFIGNLEITGKLVTGEGSYIRGNVSAIDIIIGGKIEGDITGVWSTTIQTSGVLKGDLTTEELIIESGATFDGSCSMVSGEVKPDKKELVLQQA